MAIAHAKHDMELGFDIVDLFFDRPGLLRVIDKQTRDRLQKMGGKVRDYARRSIKRKQPSKLQLEKSRGGPPNWYPEHVRNRAKASIQKRINSASEPGQPPFSHSTNQHNLRSIWYAWDPATKTVVVGPVKFSDSNVPEILEYGGTSESIVWVKRKPVRKKVKIAARPYMEPAKNTAVNKHLDLFSGMLQKRLF